MQNATDNVTSIDTTAEKVARLLQGRKAADTAANVSALAYMCDFDAQEAKLRARYVRVVEKALASGDTEKLSILVREAESHGIKL